jgi:hypothetical protein
MLKSTVYTCPILHTIPFTYDLHTPIITACQHISGKISGKLNCKQPCAGNRTQNRTAIVHRIARVDGFEVCRTFNTHRGHFGFCPISKHLPALSSISRHFPATSSTFAAIKSPFPSPHPPLPCSSSSSTSSSCSTTTTTTASAATDPPSCSSRPPPPPCTSPMSSSSCSCSAARYNNI